MNRRNAIAGVDVTAWQEFDPNALPANHRRIFKSRRQAVELYAAQIAVADIEERTGVDRRQLYRLLVRCQAVHDDGTPYGWRGLVPHVRVEHYQRSAVLEVSADGLGSGAAGAFASLLEAYPAISQWIARQVQDKTIAIEQRTTDGELKMRLHGLNRSHLRFLHQCRVAGVTAAQYPFNTNGMGIRSLSKVLRSTALSSFGRGARLAGATHLKGLPADRHAPAAQQVLDVVEFDGHRLDVRLKVVMRDPLGFEQEFEIERIWLLVIIDVYSRAVLGYHVSLNREYSRYDVIRTIEAALEPHRLRSFTVPGVRYGPLDGFPSTKLPELGFATWRWFKLDNGKANLAEDVRYALAEFIGCFIDAGPARTPDDRPYIERFFGSVASNLSSRLPGYTGSHPRDLRRALADPKGNLRLYVSLAEIEDLLEAAIAAYNASPHDGLNGRTPLEAVEHSVRQRDAMLTWLAEPKRKTLCLMQTPKLAVVRGYLNQGQRPHINFHGVRYTNPTLASTALFLGQTLRIYYNSEDLRVVRAFTFEGAEIGILKAQGAWGEVPNDLKLRQEVLRLRGVKRLRSALSQDFLREFIDNKFAKAKRSRRAASDLAQAVKTLAAAPTSMSEPGPKVVPAASAQDAEVPVPLQRVEPQKLRIRSGFIGPI